MSSSYPIREVRIALTVKSFDQAVQFYRHGLGLAVVKQPLLITSKLASA